MARIFPRACFNCDADMILYDNETSTMKCVRCEITEDGTLQGRYHSVLPEYALWHGMLVRFTDHGACHVPSPDSDDTRKP
jgi:hypothetical protein